MTHVTDVAVYGQAMLNVYKGGNAPERGITAKEHQALIDAEYERLIADKK